MPRRNRPRTKPQARRRADGTVAVPITRPDPSTLVRPLGRCEKTGLLRFAEATVAKALAQAQANRRRMGTGHVETRYFKCEGGCPDFHLTSRKEPPS